jgi:hypothetical protein
MTEAWKIVLGVVVLCGLVAFPIIPSRIWTARNQCEYEFPQDQGDLGLDFRGGAAWSWYFLYGRASWPSVRVEMGEIALRISPTTKWLAWYVPTVTIPWVQMETISASGSGVAVRIPNKPGLIRVTSPRGSLVGDLQRLGVTFNS